MRPHPTNYSESHAAPTIACSPPSRLRDGRPTEEHCHFHHDHNVRCRMPEHLIRAPIDCGTETQLRHSTNRIQRNLPMQNARRPTQTSTARTVLTAPTRDDAESDLSGLARSTPRYWLGSAALAAGIGAVVASITLTS